MDAVLISVFGFLLHLKCISGSEIYPSIPWFPQNPILVADGASCGPGPRQLKVQLQSKINFICPNTATVLQKSLVGIQPADMYENLWLLYNKTAFDECDASMDPTRRLLLSCNTPMQLKFFPVLFAQYTAEPNGLIFEGGRSYYFIATSDGTESHLSDLSGGHCEDTSNNVYMKIEVYVCKKSNQTYQDPACTSGVGELDCPNVTVVTPSSSIATSTVTPTAATSAEITIMGSMHASTSVTTSGNVCGQTVITKIISPEIISTKPMSCAGTCSKTVFSTVTATVGCERCISLQPQQHAKQEQLADGQDGANRRETWMYVAIFFLVFFGIVIIVGLAVYMKYRKKICHRYARRVAPQEERSG